ncbi:MAG: DUF1284 domain-containing protein [Rhizobiaceae bacterium]
MPSSDLNTTPENNMMPVRLRGHHFLCILTYKGAGYSEPFVANMDVKVQAIAAGHTVQLVIGPDDICNGLTAKCLQTVEHDCKAADTLRLDSLAIDAVSSLLQRDLNVAAPLTSQEITVLRKAYAQGTIRAACTGCEWKSFCDEIAADGFGDTRL